jgi:hypothetical protein
VALTNASLMVWKDYCLDFQFRGSLLPPFVALYKGFANNEKLGVQIRQNPAAPKNSQICLLMVGVGIEQIACFFSVLRLCWLWVMWNLKYLTRSRQIWAFFQDTLYPASHRRWSKSSIPLRKCRWLNVARRRSATWCS